MDWFKYIILSIVINGFFLSIIQAEKPVVIKPLKPIKINIMAFEKPVIRPLKKKVKIVKVAKKKNKPKLEKIVTKKQAKKQLAIVKKPKVKKIVKKPKVKKQVVIVEKPKVTKIVKKIEKKPKKIVKKTIKASKVLSKNVGKDLSSILHKAKYRKQTPIIYPRRAIRRMQQGKVILKVQISSNGLPLEIEIKQSSGYLLLDNAAIKTVQTWEFEPQKNNNVVIQSWVLVPVKFEIKR